MKSSLLQKLLNVENSGRFIKLLCIEYVRIFYWIWYVNSFLSKEWIFWGWKSLENRDLDRNPNSLLGGKANTSFTSGLIYKFCEVFIPRQNWSNNVIKSWMWRGQRTECAHLKYIWCQVFGLAVYWKYLDFITYDSLVRLIHIFLKFTFELFLFCKSQPSIE